MINRLLRTEFLDRKFKSILQFENIMKLKIFFSKTSKPSTCLKCGNPLKNFPILGTDFLICSQNCGYKIYSLEKMNNIEERLNLFMNDGWIPPLEKLP